VIVVAAQVHVRLFHSRTLKDKRRQVQGLLARLPQRFGVAAAEVDHLEDPRTAVLGLAVVGNSRAHLEEVLRRAVGFVALGVDGEVLDVTVEAR
jgi:uncharacterized protein YlxP (DUF503 family)